MNCFWKSAAKRFPARFVATALDSLEKKASDSLGVTCGWSTGEILYGGYSPQTYGLCQGRVPRPARTGPRSHWSGTICGL